MKEYIREILFRGKSIESFEHGRWVYGFYTNEEYNEVYETPCSEVKDHYIENQDDTIRVAPETIGQYTGLKDKNGKRIFEGDIIKYADMLDYNCYIESLECPEDYEGCDYSDIFTVDEVVYCDNVDYPAFDLNKHDFESNGLSELIASYQYHYEVIGNIHDNPELLEGEASH